MSNYTKATNFAAKDALPVGDANKKVKGVELDNEFNALANAISTKSDSNSPTFTGTPSAPTAASSTNTTQLATTAFVQLQKASPAFTGTPTAPTASAGTDNTQLATTAFVQQEITANVTSDIIVDAVYPVGSIYISTVATNPGTLLGRGTWVAFAQGRTLVGLNSSDADFDTAEETGGAKTHTLTVDEIPSHTHQTLHGGSSGSSRPSGWTAVSNNIGPGTFGGGTDDDGWSTSLSQSTGGGGAHNNLQPYIVTYMWKRTA